MLIYPDIDPIAFHIGPLAVHWYGLMYLLGFFLCWGMLLLRVQESPNGFKKEQLSDLMFYALLGLIVGGRVGYMLFYDFSTFLQYPWRVFAIWEGGMSFHGGLLGGMVGLWLYSRKIKKSFLEVTDFAVPVVPLGLGAGRIGNFINGELWGRVTDVPWGMIFSGVDEYPRHPSQIYEFFLEGVILFVILWMFSSKSRPRGAVTALFLILYSVFRMMVEFFREPDAHIGYIAWGWISEGQLLSFPMLILGIVMMGYAYQRKKV